MKQKTLHIIIYTLGFSCLCALVAIRIPGFFNILVKEKVIPEYWENTKYGELYNFNRIAHFKEDLPPSTIKYRYTPKHPDLKAADIITFGDSFFDFTRITTFPERLGDTLHKRVYYSRYDYPLNELAENNYAKGNPKVLLYETAERYIPVRFSKPQENEYIRDTRSNFRKLMVVIWHKVFIKDSEVSYSLLLTRSYISEKVYSMIATLKFDALGYIAETTPVYSLKQKVPWLFYYEEVNKDVTSFYYKHSDEDIERYCNNIADLRNKLKDRYNLDMLFMPVPCKYTIYHKFVNQDAYNNLLPRIYKGLEKRGVPVIKLYDDFIQSKEILYFGTDTHWNKKGLDLALDKTLNYINKTGTGLIAIDSTHDNNTKNSGL
jgi:hypothetical protein